MVDELISVIVPVYNVEKYLEKCVQSILNQSYKNLEIILVDDGSKDKSGDICDCIKKENENVIVVHKKNGGLSSARNAGIEVSHGLYLVFVDSDDAIEATMIQKLYSALIAEKANLAICSYDFVNEEGTPLNVHNEIQAGVYSANQVQKLLNSESYWYYVTAWNKLYKRFLFDDIRFPVGKIHEDQFVAHKIIDKASKIVVLEEQLYHYLKRERSITSSVSTKSLDDIYALQDRIEYYEMHGLKKLCPDVVNLAMRLYPASRMQLLNADGDDAEKIKKTDDVIRKMYKKYAADKNFKKSCSISFPELYYKLLKLKKEYLEKQIERLNKLKNLAKYSFDVFRSDYILVDTPTHENLGDHAIVLSEIQLLRECNPKCNIREVTAIEINHQEKFYARVTPMNRDILVPGGGFLGALWPDEEYRFRRIVQGFHKNRIIVFPQTITFDLTTEEGRQFLKESQEIYSSHPNLTIFVREKKSYAFMQQYFPTVKCFLVPDIVTLLKFPQETKKRSGILFCTRHDLEKALNEDTLQMMLDAVHQNYPEEPIQFTDTVLQKNVMPADRELEVQKKLEQFSQAKLIVTDRLHGMIFAAITNTPCIAINNSNGKVQAVYEWIRGNHYVKFIDSVEGFRTQLKILDLETVCHYDRTQIENEFEALYKEWRKI